MPTLRAFSSIIISSVGSNNFIIPPLHSLNATIPTCPPVQYTSSRNSFPGSPPWLPIPVIVTHRSWSLQITDGHCRGSNACNLHPLSHTSTDVTVCLSSTPIKMALLNACSITNKAFLLCVTVCPCHSPWIQYFSTASPPLLTPHLLSLS